MGNSDGIHADNHDARVLLDNHSPIFFDISNRQRHLIADAIIQATQHVSLHRLTIDYWLNYIWWLHTLINYQHTHKLSAHP